MSDRSDIWLAPHCECNACHRQGYFAVACLVPLPAPWPCAGARCKDCPQGTDCPGMPEELTPQAHRRARSARRKEWGGKRKHLAPLVYERDGYRCRICGCDEFAELTVDHVIPITAGGSDQIENLQTLCHACNAAKASMR